MGQEDKCRILFTKAQAESILEKVQKKTKDGQYAILWHLPKNKKLIEDYQFSEQAALEIISALNVKDDYRWAEQSTHEAHKDDIINVYKICVTLRSKNDGNEYDVNLYIKFAYKNDEEPIIFIGFHEDNVEI